MKSRIVFARNRATDALGKFRLAGFNLLSGIRLLGPRIVLILVALTAAVLVTLAMELYNERLPICPEDAAIVYFGQGQYEDGHWDEYTYTCIPVDDFTNGPIQPEGRQNRPPRRQMYGFNDGTL